MIPRLLLDADGLARLRVALGREVRSLRPVRLRLDSEGLRLSLDLPGVDWLAALLTLDGPVYRDGARILLGEEALDIPALADGLRETLARLPDRDGAGEAYRDLRLAAGIPSAAVGAYLLDVVRAYGRSLPKPPAVARSEAPRPAPKSATERSREHRARRREDERSSAVWGLALYLDDETPEPGSRVSGSAVFAYVSEVLDYAVERYVETVLDPDPRDEELHRSDLAGRVAAWDEIRSEEWETPAPVRPRPVSRRVLFEVAAAHGFRITRPKGSVALTIPREDDDTMTVAEALLDRAARMLLDENRDAIAAHLRTDETLGPTVVARTNVMSLTDIRARRSA